MKNILYIITDSRIGGTEKSFASLIRNIPLEKYKPYVFVLKGGGEMAKEYTAGGKIFVKEFNINLAGAPSLLSEIISFTDDKRIDIIHSFLFHSNMFARAAKFFRPRIFVVNSHRTTEKGNCSHIIADRLTKKFVDFEVANSEAVRAFLIKNTASAPDRITVVYNGYRLEEEFGDILRRREYSGKLRFLTVASFNKAKGHRFLLEAFSEILKINPEITLELAGDGPLFEESVGIADKLGIKDRVKFSGNVSDIKRVMLRNSLLIIPSFWEGMPNVLFEAVSAGMYVVSSDVGGVREAGLPTVSVFKPGDKKGILAEVEKYLLSEIDQAIFAESYDIVKERFSVAKMVEGYCKIYDK